MLKIIPFYSHLWIRILFLTWSWMYKMCSWMFKMYWIECLSSLFSKRISYYKWNMLYCMWRWYNCWKLTMWWRKHQLYWWMCFDMLCITFVYLFRITKYMYIYWTINLWKYKNLGNIRMWWWKYYEWWWMFS